MNGNDLQGNWLQPGSAMSVIPTGLVLMGVLLAAAPAAADEFPMRKPGLWSMRASGGPFGGQVMEQCIDAKTDDLMRVDSGGGKTCSKPVVTRRGDEYRVRVECKGERSSQVMTGVYTMKDNVSYSGDMQMRFTPPMNGVSEMNTKVDGRWLGACKAGMKPGDTTIQGMGNFNPLDASRNSGPGVGAMSPDELKKAREAMMKQLQQQK